MGSYRREVLRHIFQGIDLLDLGCRLQLAGVVYHQWHLALHGEAALLADHRHQELDQLQHGKGKRLCSSRASH